MAFTAESLIVGAGIGLAAKVAYDFFKNGRNNKSQPKVCQFHHDLFRKTDELIRSNIKSTSVLENIDKSLGEQNRLLVEVLRKKE